MNAKERRRERRKNRAIAINAIDASQCNNMKEDSKMTEILLHPPSHTRRYLVYLILIAGSLLFWILLITLIIK